MKWKTEPCIFELYGKQNLKPLENSVKNQPTDRDQDRTSKYLFHYKRGS